MNSRSIFADHVKSHMTVGSAAQQFINGMPETADARTSRKRKQTEGALSSPGTRHHAKGTARTELHNAYRRIVNREPNAGDITYSFDYVGNGLCIAVLSISGLPCEMWKRRWDGAACSTKRLARERAAETALRDLHDDPVLAPLIAEIPSVDVASEWEGDDANYASTSASNASNGALPGELNVAPGGGTRMHNPVAVTAEKRSPCFKSPQNAPWDTGKGTCPDAKSHLAIFCQRQCQRCMQKGDLEYSVVRSNGVSVATVRLHCLGGAVFSGFPQISNRLAERSAAAIALERFSSQRVQLFQGVAKRRKSENGSAAGSTALAVGVCVKSRLHKVCAKIVGREPRVGDILYDAVQTLTGTTASLQLPFVRGPLEGRVWVSEAKASKHDAKSHAAWLALEDLRKHVEYGLAVASLSEEI